MYMYMYAHSTIDAYTYRLSVPTCTHIGILVHVHTGIYIHTYMVSTMYVHVVI